MTERRRSLPGAAVIGPGTVLTLLPAVAAGSRTEAERGFTE
ncbi:hypothetical protein [Streptomyces sp. NPDC048332]